MAHKHVAQLPHNAVNRTVMNVDICTRKIADRLQNAMGFRIADEPGMPARIHVAPTHSQTKLEWHILCDGTGYVT